MVALPTAPRRLGSFSAAALLLFLVGATLGTALRPLECDKNKHNLQVLTIDEEKSGTLPVTERPNSDTDDDWEPCLKFSLPEEELRTGHLIIHLTTSCQGNPKCDLGLKTNVQIRQGDSPITETDQDVSVLGPSGSIPVPFDTATDPFFISFRAHNVSKEAISSGVVYSIKINTVFDCLGDCSRAGQCNNGTCTCEDGFDGDDCSLRVTEFSVPRLPSRPVLLVPGLGSSRLDTTPCENHGGDVDTGSMTEQCWIDAGPPGGPAFMVDMMTGEARLPTFEDKLKRHLLGDIDGTGGMTPSVCKNSKVKVDPASAGIRGISELLPEQNFKAMKALNTSMTKANVPIDMEGILKKVTHMKPMVDFLFRIGYVEDDTLFGFPWDWRGSVRSKVTIDALRERIKALSDASGDDDSLVEEDSDEVNKNSIDIVTHGEGGLVVLAYIAQYPEEADKYIENWIALGAPFKGSAGSAVGHFIYGRDFNNPYVSPETGLAMLSGMPSMYEILPRNSAGTEKVATIQYGIDRSPAPKVPAVIENMLNAVAPGMGDAIEQAEDNDPNENKQPPQSHVMTLAGFVSGQQLAQSLADVQAMVRTSAEKTMDHGLEMMEEDMIVPRPWSQKAWQWAKGTWKMFDRIQRPRKWRSLRLHAVGADSADEKTPNSLKFIRPVRKLSELRMQQAEASYTRGDEYVPLSSAIASVMTSSQKCSSNDCPGNTIPQQIGDMDHIGLLHDKRSHALVRGLMGEQCSWEGIWEMSGTYIALYQDGDRLHGTMPGGLALIGKATKGGLLEAKIPKTGTCVKLSMGASCLHGIGSIRPCNEAGETALAAYAAKIGAAVQQIHSVRLIGKQCWARSARKCSVTNKQAGEQPMMIDGVQPCLFGFWSTNCLASRCAPGSCLIYSSHGVYTCQPCDGIKPRCPKVRPFFCPTLGICEQSLDECLQEVQGKNHPGRHGCPLNRPYRCKGRCHSKYSECSKAEHVKHGDFLQPDTDNKFKCSKKGMFVCPKTGNCVTNLVACGGHHTADGAYSLPVSCGHTQTYCARTGSCVTDVHSCYSMTTADDQELAEEKGKATHVDVHCPVHQHPCGDTCCEIPGYPLVEDEPPPEPPKSNPWVDIPAVTQPPRPKNPWVDVPAVPAPTPPPTLASIVPTPSPVHTRRRRHSDAPPIESQTDLPAILHTRSGQVPHAIRQGKEPQEPGIEESEGKGGEHTLVPTPTPHTDEHHVGEQETKDVPFSKEELKKLKGPPPPPPPPLVVLAKAAPSSTTSVSIVVVVIAVTAALVLALLAWQYYKNRQTEPEFGSSPLELDYEQEELTNEDLISEAQDIDGLLSGSPSKSVNKRWDDAYGDDGI